MQRNSLPYLFISIFFLVFRLAEHATYFTLLEAVECAAWKSAFLLWRWWCKKDTDTYEREKKGNKTLPWYSKCSECSNCNQVCIKCDECRKWQSWQNNTKGEDKKNWAKWKWKRKSIRSKINLQLGICRFDCESCYMYWQNPYWELMVSFNVSLCSEFACTLNSRWFQD